MKKTNEKKDHKLYSKGVTIIALMITIVVMIILSTITIKVINGELFNYTGETKTKTDVVTEKTAIIQAFNIAKGVNGSQPVTASQMQEALNKTLGGGEATVTKSGSILTINITGTTRSYHVNDTTGEIAEE